MIERRCTRRSARACPPVLAILLLMALIGGCREDEQAKLLRPAALGPDEVAVVALEPLGSELSPQQPLALVFSQPIAESAPTGGAAAVAHQERIGHPPMAEVRLSPEVSGTWEWGGDDRLIFFPEEPYQPNTAYTVTIARDLGTAEGLELRGPRSFTFHATPFTARLELHRERVVGGERVDQVLGSATFNYPVSQEAFRASFTLRRTDGGAIDYQVTTPDESEVVSFRSRPIPIGPQDVTVVATIDKNLRPVGGSAPLDERAAARLRLPAIERVAVRELRQEANDGKVLLRLDFNAALEPAAVESALTVEPSVANLTVEGRGRQVLLAGDWQFGQSYRIELARDLKGQQGMSLERTFRRTVLISDLEPHVQIVGQGSYLSLRGEQRVAVRSVNVESLAVYLEKVPAENLVHFLQDVRWHWPQNVRDFARFGFPVASTTLPVSADVRNREVLTPVDLEPLLPNGSRGILRLAVSRATTGERSGGRRPARGNETMDVRLLVTTDLGLVAKQAGEDLLVAVVSVRDLVPLPDVTVTVRSYDNQIMRRGRTGPDGTVQFTALMPDSGLPDEPWRNRPSRRPPTQRSRRPYLVTAERGADLSFLSFQETRIATGNLDVGGIAAWSAGYRAFLYSDRGVYRPGDEAHLTWIVRDAELRPPPELPLLLSVSNPLSPVFTRARVSSGPEGTGTWTLQIPTYAATGHYHVKLGIGEDEVLGSLAIRVEDFLPERMKADLELRVAGKQADLVRPEQTLTATLTATTLFGPPAADRHVEARATYRPAPPGFPDWPDYRFGDFDLEQRIPDQTLGARTTDADGQTSWDVPLPQLADFQGWIQVAVTAQVQELGGGRAVEAAGHTDFAPHAHVLGLRRVLSGQSDAVAPGDTLRFLALLLDLDGQPVAGDAQLRVLRRRWQTVLRQDEQGRYRYVSEADELQVQESPVTLQAGPTQLPVVVASQGSYRLVVQTPDGQARGSLDFYVYGWGYSPWAMSYPERVGLKLDRESYREGETLVASIEAPFPGLLLLSIEKDRVLERRWVRMQENTARVELPVPPGLAPNGYLVATLLRPLDALEVHAPARAFGAVPLQIDVGPSRLAVELDAPAKMRPERELAVRFRLPDLPAGRTAPVTVAAVDEGILGLIDFATPSPLDFFWQKVRLGVQTHDTWALLLPEYSEIARQEGAGGGSEGVRGGRSGEVEMRLNPLAVRRVEPVSLWSGLVQGGSAWQTVSFAVPSFQGSLRIMAVAAAGPRFGSQQAAVTVADPIVLAPNLPRFLAPKDEILIPVQVYNGITEESGQSVPIHVQLAVEGPVRLVMPDQAGAGGGSPGSRTIEVAGGSESLVVFAAQALDSIGEAAFIITGEAEVPGDGQAVRTRDRVALAVRPAWPLQVQSEAGALAAGDTLARQLPATWYEGTSRTRLTVSPLPIARFGPALTYLLRYPYGCLEQITSRTLPLLYLPELASALAPETIGAHDADYFVNSALDRMLASAMTTGQFHAWPGYGAQPASDWVQVYATHLLLLASRQGYVIPALPQGQPLDYLARMVRSDLSDQVDRRWPAARSSSSEPADEALRARCYALYVLALAGRPDAGAMDRLLSDQVDRLPVAARAQLAGAYALTGQQAVFDRLLPAVGTPIPEPDGHSCCLASPARDEAVWLEVLAAVAPDHPQVPALVQRLTARAPEGYWANTQENAFALLALGRLVARTGQATASGSIRLDGEEVGRFSGRGAAGGTVLASQAWMGRRLVIANDGPGRAYWSLTGSGVPRTGGETQVAEGLRIRRTYLDTEGHPLDGGPLRQGQVVIGRLSLASERGPVDNVIVTDLLPAGLEIEQATLTDPELLRAVTGSGGGSTGGSARARGGARRARGRENEDDVMTLPIAHVEPRDDRLLLFTSASPGERTHHYLLRVVTAGRFLLPPVRAEAMYEPQVRAAGPVGEVTVESP
jgi:uncharacterized protein YfaS (alpha-2-macroglobulin family)